MARAPFRQTFPTIFILSLAIVLPLHAASKKDSPAIFLGQEGKLVYAADPQGNRVPDFSHCGYAGGDRTIPNAPVRVVVAAVQGDSTARIQKGLDYVARLPLDPNGLRGAVLLLKGRHEISGSLRLAASGVILRGQGMGGDGTVLFAAGLDRRTLIRISGVKDRVNLKSSQIKDDYVPVGSTSVHLDAAGGLKTGDTVSLVRPCTQAWIDRLGMTEFGGGIGDWRLTWKPGSRGLLWDRVVTSVDADRVTLDAPITTAIEKTFGGGELAPYSWPGRISNVGIENLRCESAFDPANSRDESHSWLAITAENAANIWVRQVAAAHFVSFVAIYETCKWVTVQNCLALAPVSEEGGYRRHTFFTMGQMTLFLHCHAERGRHDFSVGHCAAGPNAFVQCDATLPLGDSGPIESWASGVLYDCVTIDGNGLSLANRGSSPHGAGWAAANSVLWQCNASLIRCVNPPTAHNWAFGCWGEFEGNGVWHNSNSSAKPESLYVAQLADRLGPEAALRVQLLHRSTDDSTNPTLDQAARLIAAAQKPALQLAQYIATASIRNPIPFNPGDAMPIEKVGDSKPTPSRPTGNSTPATRVILTNGWLTSDGKLLIGARTNVAWWRGNIHPSEAPASEAALTRFVPGRSGPGYTDDLPQLAGILATNGVAALSHHYGLWYERRRDDHERVRRMTGDVWPPLYEPPFARTGQGTAWDGLSLYDLTKYNPWYWSRLKQFADLCDQRGIVLFHQNYFQHNILEAGAHWADFPWRSANNVNNTGFPEPPPYAGDKRIFMAEQFYNVTNPVRRELHRAYIRQGLQNFDGNSNVIQFIGAEYTGPLHFMRFWLDTIGEWKKETGRKPLVALSCTKDVQDAILSDRQRNDLVDCVDFSYWWQTDQGVFAPQGGQNLAPRQFERQWRGGRPTDKNLAIMAAEYRRRYPNKPIICPFSQAGWAFACAGGSVPNLPRSTDARLLAALPGMQPWVRGSSEDRWVLQKAGQQYLICLSAQSPTELDLSAETGSFAVRSVDLKTGAVTDLAERVTAHSKAHLPKPNNSPALLWLVR